MWNHTILRSNKWMCQSPLPWELFWKSICHHPPCSEELLIERASHNPCCLRNYSMKGKRWDWHQWTNELPGHSRHLYRKYWLQRIHIHHPRFITTTHLVMKLLEANLLYIMTHSLSNSTIINKINVAASAEVLFSWSSSQLSTGSRLYNNNIVFHITPLPWLFMALHNILLLKYITK